MFLVGSDSYLLLFHVEKSCAKITVTKCNNSFIFFAHYLRKEQEQVFVTEKPLSTTEPHKELKYAAKGEAFHIFT